MRYLLDANVLIDADRDYYPLDRVPEFWAWLLHQADLGVLAMPPEMHGEVVAGKGELVNWLKEHRDAMVLGNEADATVVRRVLAQGYAPNLTEDEVEKIGNDPLIVAYALAIKSGATVVTTEVSKPSAQRGNRRLPDVCAVLSVRCINTFRLVQELNFRTDWQTA